MATKIFNSVFPAPNSKAASKDHSRQQLISDIRPAVAKALRHTDPYYALQGIVDILRHGRVVDRGFVAYGLPLAKIMNKLEELLLEYGQIILGIEDENYQIPMNAVDEDLQPVVYRTHYATCSSMSRIEEPEGDLAEPDNVKAAQQDLFLILHGLQEVGLGGTEAQKTFARVMDALVTKFVQWSYGNTFEVEPELPAHLKFWIENIFARFVIQTLDILRVPGQEQLSMPPVSFADVQKWQEMAITRMGKLRVKELFDIIVNWDSTKSGIDDLKNYTVNPATRSYVTSHFINVLSHRLLQPGASTTEILQVYISTIRAFRRLDPKGVLLDRVARPVRHYLRTREDTVRIVVNGILAEVELDDDGNPISNENTPLSELAIELKTQGFSENDNDGELDWNNMDWTPDPIDAAPDYKKSKTADVVGTLISLFDSKEVFVKQLQSSLADRLLEKKANFDQEISVLEHLKIRFGDSALQACEVMLRDILDSRRTDNVIRNDPNIGPPEESSSPSREIRNASPPSPIKLAHSLPIANDANVQFHAKILSRLFWPSQTLDPPDDPDSYDDAASFAIPSSITALQETYSRGFETLKQSRKLTWLNNLGYVTVELDLEDRIFQADDITPIQASVIYAFQEADSANASAGPVSRTIDELSSALTLPAYFVRTACTFWVSKQILVPTPSTAPGTSYTVLERLPTDTPSTTTSPAYPSSAKNQSAAATLAPSEPSTPIPSRSAIPPAKAALYNQFILSMLTNQGAMPLARIGMMLGIVVPGGWGYGNEELRELLVQLGREGKVEMGNGGVWKIVKD